MKIPVSVPNRISTPGSMVKVEELFTVTSPVTMYGLSLRDHVVSTLIFPLTYVSAKTAAAGRKRNANAIARQSMAFPIAVKPVLKLPIIDSSFFLVLMFFRASILDIKRIFLISK